MPNSWFKNFTLNPRELYRRWFQTQNPRAPELDATTDSASTTNADIDSAPKEKPVASKLQPKEVTAELVEPPRHSVDPAKLKFRVASMLQASTEEETKSAAQEFEKALSSRNEQQKAVINSKGSSLVIAVPGAGKTSTMAVKVAQSINEGLSPSEILGITFTRTGAAEMKNKIKKLVSEEILEGQDLPIYTFHALCLKIMKEAKKIDPQAFGKFKNLLAEEDQIKILDDIFEQLWVDPAYKFIRKLVDKAFDKRNVIDIIKNLKRSGVNVKAYSEALDAFKARLTDYSKNSIITDFLSHKGRDINAGSAALTEDEIARKFLDDLRKAPMEITDGDGIPRKNPDFIDKRSIQIFRGFRNRAKNEKRGGDYLKNFQSLVRDFCFMSNDAEINEAQKTKLINRLRILGEVFRRYQKVIESKDMKAYDLDDLIPTLNKIIKAKGDEKVEYAAERAALEKFRDGFKVVISDEFQDSNVAQYSLLKFLGYESDVILIGDPEQAIFGFQGGDSDNILRFNREAKPEVLTLNTNYRSQQKILDAAYALINQNSSKLSKHDDFKGRIDDRLISGRDDVPLNPVEIHKHLNNDTEAVWIAQKIQELQASGVDLNRIAVLTRTNDDINEIASKLVIAGIPFTEDKKDNTLANPEIRKIVDLFKVIQNPTKRNAVLKRLLQYDFIRLKLKKDYDIDREDIDQLSKDYLETTKDSRFKNSFFEYMRDHKIVRTGDQGQVVKETDGLQRFAQDIHEFFSVSCEPGAKFMDLFHQILEWSKAKEHMGVGNKNLTRLMRLKFLQDLAKSACRKKPYETALGVKGALPIQRFLKDVQMRSRNRNRSGAAIKDAGEGVKLKTAHRSKGEEYQHVFIYKANNRNWGRRHIAEKFEIPNGFLDQYDEESKFEESNDEEERRLFYVAMTRAEENLYISHNDEDVYDPKKTGKPSIFINDITQYAPQDCFSTYDHTSDDPINLEENTERLQQAMQTPNWYDLELRHQKAMIQQETRDTVLTATKYADFQHCGMYYFFRYIEPKFSKHERSNAAVLGSAMHLAIEEITKRRMPSNMTIDEKKKMFERLFQDAVAKLADKKTPKDRDEIEQEGLKILRQFLYQNARKIFETEVISTERKVKANLERDGVVVPLKGIIDRVENVTGRWGRQHSQITDWKTGRPPKRRQDKQEDSRIYHQLSFYAMLSALEAQAGKKGAIIPDRARATYLRKGKNGHMDVTFPVNQEMLEATAARVIDSFQKIVEGDFNRTDDLSKCINTHGECPFYSACQVNTVPGEEMRALHQIEKQA